MTDDKKENSPSPKNKIDLLQYSGVRYILKEQQEKPEEKNNEPQASVSAPKQLEQVESQATESGRIALPWKNMAELREAALKCEKCALASTRNNVVFGEVNENADLMFIGEGPGHHEDIQGKPFVGRAGKLLDKMIVAMGYTREQVYIANIVKCRPPGNRNPLPDEVASCVGYLKAQIVFIQPKIIVLLGSVAVRSLLNIETPISKVRGTFLDYLGIPIVPVFHPAYLIRNPAKKKETWEDLQKVMAFLDKETG